MSSSNSIPKKALILHCPLEPNQPIPNVDLVTLKGCLGQMALEETKDLEDTIVLQLLGLYDKQDNQQIKAKFKQRFNDMSLAIISNNESTLDIAQQLDCKKDTLKSIDQIVQLLSSSGSGIDVIFVDLTDYKDAWIFTDELIASIANNEIIESIISPFTVTPEEQTDQPLFTSSIIPRQSHMMKNGQQININQQTSLKYAYFHAGSGRTDSTTKYSMENGGNNKILAWHFLAEIGHKLGFVPKYGA